MLTTNLKTIKDRQKTEHNTRETHQGKRREKETEDYRNNQKAPNKKWQ